MKYNCQSALYSILIFCTSCLLALNSIAQVFVETYPPVSNNTDMGVRISGLANLSDRLPYDRISGSPFWKDDWQTASLYGSNEKEHWLCKTKLNLATGEVYYLDKEGRELVTDDGLIRRIVFHKNDDTTAVLAVFVINPETVKLNQEVRKTYLQVLNAGGFVLLKLDKRTLSSADSLFGTLKRYFFTSNTSYYISHGDMVRPLKKLDKDNVLGFVPGASGITGWVQQNRINFKKEEDVVVFLNYYNSQNK